VSETDALISRSTGDDVLWERFLLGDDRAFNYLYERYNARVLTYLRTILKEHLTVADDLWQEAFIRVYRERKRRHELLDKGTYTPVDNFKGWLFRIARNLALDHFRSHRLTTTLTTEDGEERPTEETTVRVHEAYPDLYPDEEIVTSDAVIAELKKCIDELPPSLRDIYLLREVNGLEYDEVARAVETTEENARQRVCRARKTLRKALEKYLKKIRQT
jgi:RNA polymerase sigma-70 factor, ECF subfamily